VNDTIPIRRRLVGAALRRYRENLGHSLEDAALILQCDRSKISRIETGHRGIRTKELRELLTEYGVTEQGQDALLAIARGIREHGWWEEYADVLPDAHRDYLIIETAASEIITYQPQQVPALLQTEDYARAITEASPDIPAERKDKIVESVLARQQVILAERQPTVHAVIGEGALRQMVGGSHVMRSQLARLAHAATDDPQVTIRVLPFTAGANAALGIGSPTLLRFFGAPGIGVVHLAGLVGGVCLEDPAAIAAYLGALTHVQASALTPAESAQLIRNLTCT
jgi:transcriptional regulator with XRE-family HTH domain